MTTPRNRLVDDLAGHVRDRIVGGDLTSGTRLTEQGLANEYSVARPTVRSAIDVLVSDGLLTRAAHTQPQVATIADADIGDILALLELTERLALARLSDTAIDLRPLRAAINEPLHHFLHILVTTALSPRLENVHRRATFELLIWLRHQEHTNAIDAASTTTQRQLVQALATAESSASRCLQQLQHERLSTLPAWINVEPAASVTTSA